MPARTRALIAAALLAAATVLTFVLISLNSTPHTSSAGAAHTPSALPSIPSASPSVPSGTPSTVSASPSTPNGSTARVPSSAIHGFNVPGAIAADSTRVWVANEGGAGR